MTGFSLKILGLSLITAASLSACSTADTPKPLILEDLWTLSDLDSPESILPSADGQSFYVSNVNGEGADVDGNGYIARVSKQGGMINQKWATGLNAPKGMGLSGTTLYVADIDHLALIDTETGDVTARIEAPGAGFLNDVSVSERGIFIADSANARIYEYADGALSVWLENPQLGGVNGLLAQDDRLLITTMSAGELLSLDWKTKSLTIVAGGMEDADGLTELADGTFLVSSWPGTLYHVKQDGTHTVLLDTKDEPVFLNDFHYEDGTIYIPNWQPGSLRAYAVTNKP